jgi:hypothetical protein
MATFCDAIFDDGVAKTRKHLVFVMPAHAGIQ